MNAEQSTNCFKLITSFNPFTTVKSNRLSLPNRNVLDA